MSRFETTIRRSLAGALALTLGVAAAADAQHRQRATLPDTTAITVTAESGVPEIPFELVNNHVILPVSVNGSPPVRVVLDTGMPAAGLALHEGETTRGLEIGFDPTIAARVGGAGGSGHTVSAKVAMSESLTLPGVRLDDTRILMLPEMHGIASYHEGVMGYSLFNRFVVEVDYQSRRVRLREPSDFAPPEGAIVLPLELRDRVPYTKVRVQLADGGWFDADVVVDLGASHAISLNTDASEHVRLPDRAIPTLLGRGVSGDLRGHVGRISGLDLGGAVLRDVVASFPKSDHQNPRGIDSLDGNLGSGALKRFNVAFDYAGRRMVLVPNDTLGEPFRFDRSGVILAYGGELRVEHVIEGSAAERQGVAAGDLLTHVDGSPVTSSDAHRVRELLRGDGEVRLSFLRDGESYERLLSLKPLI